MMIIIIISLRTAAILEKSKNCYISAAVQAMFTKFGERMQFDPRDSFDRQKFKISKIQDGGGRHLKKSQNGHISATVSPILRNLAG